MKDPEKLCVLLSDTTVTYTVNIGGTKIHSSLGIKPSPKLLNLFDKLKVSLKNRLSEARMVLIDELSRFLEIFFELSLLHLLGWQVYFWVTFNSRLQSWVSQYILILTNMIK